MTATVTTKPLATEKIVLPVQGMDCPDCARTIERGVGGLAGVEHAAVNFASAQLHVSYAPAQVEVVDISRRVRELGYVAEPPTAEATASTSGAAGLLREHRTTIAGALLTVAGIVVGQTSAPEGVSIALYLAAVWAAGLPVARKG